MATTSKPRRKDRGEIECLPSGSLRVRVYAGTDPVTGKRHRLEEMVPADPDVEDEAQKTLTRLLSQLDEQRNARTKATVNQLLDRYFDLLRVEPTTMDGYESLARNHIRPLLGKVQLGKIDGDVLDSFYKALRTCGAPCQRRKFTEHRTNREHACDQRCKPHKCEGLQNGSLRKIHAILTGAGKRAIRSRWLGVNPFSNVHSPTHRGQALPTHSHLRGAIMCGALKPGDKLPPS